MSYFYMHSSVYTMLPLQQHTIHCHPVNDPIVCYSPTFYNRKILLPISTYCEWLPQAC